MAGGTVFCAAATAASNLTTTTFLHNQTPPSTSSQPPLDSLFLSASSPFLGTFPSSAVLFFSCLVYKVSCQAKLVV